MITLKRWLRPVLFVLLLGLLLGRINGILEDKGIEYGYYSSSAQHRGFYQLKKRTADVLFLGSSHCYCAFAPQMFYDRHGIRSYNLGTSQQSAWLSYYWLKEALRSQHPSVVVLEAFYLTTAPGGTGDEASYRKALDGMKMLSPVKAEAVFDICGMNLDPKLTPESFYLTNLRYHNRWSSLGEEDFRENPDRVKLKGYVPIGEAKKEENFTALTASDLEGAEPVKIEERVITYLDRMRALCDEEGITLLLVKSPTTHWSAGEHLAVSSWAQEAGVPFIDYNLEDTYAALGYDFPEDSYDYGHANIRGAAKIADALGQELLTAYGVSAAADPQWEDTAPYFAGLTEELEAQSSQPESSGSE